MDSQLNPGGYTGRDFEMMGIFSNKGPKIFDAGAWSDPNRRPDSWTNYEPPDKDDKDEEEEPATPAPKEDPSDDENAFPF